MAFAQARQGAKAYKPSPSPPDPWGEMSWFEKTLDVLSRPTYASANAAKALLTGRNPFEAALKGLTGEQRTTYSDVLGVVGMDKGLARSVLGFAGDVLLDPTTYLTFGAGAAGKGAQVTLKGAKQVLTPAAVATKDAALALKTAQAARILEKAKPARIEALYAKTGMKGVAETFSAKPELAKEILPNLLGERAVQRGLERAVEGQPVTSAMRALEGLKPSEIVKSKEIRWMGAPIPGAKQVVAAPFKLAGKAYTAAEAIPGVGGALTYLREFGSKAKAAMKTVFSTSTGLPEFDRLIRQYADVLDFKTMEVINRYKQTVLAPLGALKKSDPKAYEDGLKQVSQFLEGTVDAIKKKVPDANRIADIGRHLTSLEARLQEMHALKGRQLQGTAHAISKTEGVLGEAQKILQSKQAAAGALGIIKGGPKKIAEKLAKKETKQVRAAHRAEFDQIKKTLREQGISAGGLGPEFAKHIPKSLRRKATGTNSYDIWMERLREAGLLPEGATDIEDLGIFLKGIFAPAQAVSPEAMRGAAEAMVKQTRQARSLQRQIAKQEAKVASLERERERLQMMLAKGSDPALERQLAHTEKVIAERKAEQAALQATPSVLKTEYVPTRKWAEGVHPAVKAAGEFLRDRFEQVWQAEQKGLALPPNRMEYYLPHYMKGEVRDALVDVINSDARKVLKHEHIGSVTEALRRTTGGRVDELKLGDLVESGKLDPSKVQDALKKMGIHLTADDLLVFEQNPVYAAIRRELSSVRALNASSMAREIIESPAFNKAKVNVSDAHTIKMTLLQHPGHAVFVPTKQWIEKVLTPSERAALYKGERKGMAGRFLEEVGDVQLDELAKRANAAQIEAYILPKEVAEHLSRAYSMQFDEESIKAFLKMTDKMTGWWKTMTTVVRPGFHVRNAVSNLWQMMLAGMRNPATMARAGFLLANPDGVKGVGRYSGREVLELADRYGIRRTGFVGADIDDLIRREVEPSTLNILSVRGPLARWGGKLGTTVEDHARIALFMDGLEQGMDAASSAMRVKKYLFDYRNLTRIEKGIFRRLLPFYTWTRMSIPLALETLVTKPGAVSALEKIRVAGEKGVEDPVKREYLSEWLREGIGVPVRKGPSGETEYFLLKGWIPTTDLAKLDLNEVLGMLHPAIKTSVETLINKNLFTGRPVERFPGELKKFLGIPMPGKYENIARNAVALVEVDRALFSGASPGQAVTGLATGVRTYKQDKIVQMRAKVFELQKAMGDMRNAVVTAEKKYGGDSVIVRQARERLERVIEERDYVKQALLEIDPEALSPKRDEPTKPPQMPTTIDGMRRRLSIERLLGPTLRKATK